MSSVTRRGWKTSVEKWTAETVEQEVLLKVIWPLADDKGRHCADVPSVSRYCGQSQPELEASPGHRRGEKHANCSTFGIKPSASAPSLLLLWLLNSHYRLYLATGYIYEIIPFISDSCRKALITVRRRLINRPHVKYSHSAAMKHVAASLVAPDKQTCWLSRPVVMCYWENRKRKDRKLERNRKASQHKTQAVCVVIWLVALW